MHVHTLLPQATSKHHTHLRTHTLLPQASCARHTHTCAHTHTHTLLPQATRAHLADKGQLAQHRSDVNAAVLQVRPRILEFVLM